MPDQSLVVVSIDKLVEGGQGIGVLPDGKKVFVWNALPGETLRVRIIKQKHSYAEAIAEEVIQASAERIAPEEANYLATSPWQMMTFAAENRYKQVIVEDIFGQAKVNLPAFQLIAANDGSQALGYRNKTEYGFWGDDDGLHLAAYQRGSHGKQIIEGSLLTMTGMDGAARQMCEQLHDLHIRAGDLKTIIVRSSQNGTVVVALYVKPKRFPVLSLPSGAQGLRVYHSNPKSPASVRTTLLQEVGDCLLTDSLLGVPFTYDVDSFFQVNVPIFERALQRIKSHIDESAVIDMYAGVGSIGLSVAHESVTLVELDPATAAMARLNAAASRLNVDVIEAATDKVLDCINGESPVIFDPPRSGLHERVIDRVLEAVPPKLIYLSCNPVTQARDLVWLSASYNLVFFEAYNFFPRTPHIETLSILMKR